MKLLRCGRTVSTMFDLLGRKEDDMTYALGFVASRSHAFAVALAEALGGEAGPPEEGVVRLQTSDGGGRTDVEIRWPKRFHAVFEAKRGPHLPSVDQLRKYTQRLRASDAAVTRLVAVTNATQLYAENVLPDSLAGVDLQHLTWRRIRDLVRRARPDENHRNKRLLDEFAHYLTEILGMENTRSNLVYVVSLGAGGAWNLDFKDVVNKRRRYFCPAKGRWPAAPPNYIAFRYDGILQSIHHVDSFEVFDNPSTVFKDAKNRKIEPHFLLKLGPPIRPPKEVRTGPKIRQSLRVWCMIDLLLTSATITDARDETNKRLGRDAEDLTEDED